MGRVIMARMVPEFIKNTRQLNKLTMFLFPGMSLE